MRFLLLFLCGCVSSAVQTTTPRQERRQDGVVWFLVGRTVEQTKRNNAIARDKAAEICKPKFAMIEVDELYDLASLDLLKGRTRMKITFECI